MSEDGKPRIWFSNKPNVLAWVCSSMTSPNGTYAFGDSPSEAYNAWVLRSKSDARD